MVRGALRRQRRGGLLWPRSLGGLRWVGPRWGRLRLGAGPELERMKPGLGVWPRFSKIQSLASAASWVKTWGPGVGGVGVGGRGVKCRSQAPPQTS